MLKQLPLTALGLFIYLARSVLGDTIGPLPATCTAGTLDNYIALAATGCSLNHVVFSNFAFSVLASGGGAIPVAPSDITVTPAVVDERYSLNFSSPRFAVSVPESVKYLLAYTVDPHPIFSFTDDLQVDSPISPGLVSITTNLCLGAAFSSSTCSLSATSVMVLDNGITSQLSDSVSLAPINVMGVRNEILLDASKGGSADFSSLTNSTGFVPEPASWLLTGSALLGLGLLRLRWFRRYGFRRRFSPEPCKRVM